MAIMKGPLKSAIKVSNLAQINLKYLLFIFLPLVLHNYPDETAAFHCKAVCFIHMSKFEEALHFMKNTVYAR